MTMKTIEDSISKKVCETGEWDGYCHVFFLDNIKSGIDGYPDATGLYVGNDGILSVHVTNEDDTDYYFASLNELSRDAVYEIYDQVMEG